MLFNYRQLKSHNSSSLVTLASVARPLKLAEDAHYWVRERSKRTQSLGLKNKFELLIHNMSTFILCLFILVHFGSHHCTFWSHYLYLTTSITSYFADLSLIQNINQLCKYVKLLNRLWKFSPHLPAANKWNFDFKCGHLFTCLACKWFINTKCFQISLLDRRATPSSKLRPIKMLPVDDSLRYSPFFVE